MRFIVLVLCLFGSAAVSQQRTDSGVGASIRTLDRISGQVADFELTNGQTVERGNLVITLDQCRYPEGEVNADAFAFLTIRDQRHENAAFEGWMIASSPSLSALEHPRYDVWVLRCATLS